MINELSLADINKVAPYAVTQNVVTKAYGFVTDKGCRISIDFDDDFMIQSGDSYQLIIGNANHKKSPSDRKVKMTILAIVEEFFRKNQAALLYICETGDGKQRMRNRMFSYWFDAYEGNFRFFMNTTCIIDEDGIENFATLILRNDHPKLVEIITEFTITAKVLRDKPTNENGSVGQD